MSEYWKSTPKYWCKHCKTFVRDTKLEKQHHEATPKHQGNLKRFLRDLHRGHEREERDARRAKDEVARLNGVVSASSSGVASDGAAPWTRKPVAVPANSTLRQATPADRKQQPKQLAEMGVAIPEEFRREMAMAGDWQTLLERVDYNDVKQEGDSKEFKPGELSAGVRKRKHEGQEEDEEEEKVARKAWGSVARSYPGTGGSEGDDLDALLKNTKVMKREDGVPNEDSKLNSGSATQQPELSKTGGTLLPEAPLIKKEDFDAGGILSRNVSNIGDSGEIPIKTEDEPINPDIVFKKRKLKQIRQR